MNRLFGTKKAPAPVIEKPVVEEKQIDLVEQSQKVENRVNEIDGKIDTMDAQINDLYMKVRNSRGSQRDFHKQRLIQLLKRRKMLNNQQKNYMNHQMALDNVAFTQENVTNTMEMAQAMKQGCAANIELMKKVDVDQLQDIKDDMQEMMWECNEINDALNYDLEDDVDEDELEDELCEIENELKLKGLLEPKTAQPAAQNKLGAITN